MSWDLDGTLYSKKRLDRLLLFWLTAAVLKGESKVALRDLREFLRFGDRVHRQRRSEGHQADIDPHWREHLLDLEERWLVRALKHLGPLPASSRALDRIRGLNIPQVVISDVYGRHKLAALGIEDYFSEVIACEQIGFWKPAPEPFWHVEKQFGVSPDEHLHIGDRPDLDGRGCTNAGCRFLLVTRLEGSEASPPPTQAPA